MQTQTGRPRTPAPVALKVWELYDEHGTRGKVTTDPRCPVGAGTVYAILDRPRPQIEKPLDEAKGQEATDASRRNEIIPSP